MEEKPKKDKFKAIWLSHSSIADFLRCPRLYYYRSVYRDPRTNNRMTIMTPALALGSMVHDAIDSVSEKSSQDRFSEPLVSIFERMWEKVSGEKGGFWNDLQEEEYKDRGRRMLQKIDKDPGPLANKAVKIKTEDGLPFYWFSEEENIILCGKVDWLEYLEETDSVHIIDFKTGKNEEDESSLQLPIYLLLVTNTQGRKVEKASYWYLDKDRGPEIQILPEAKDAEERVSSVASRIKLARQLNHFKCDTDGCRFCIPFERVIKGEGKKVGSSSYGQDIFILTRR